LPKYLQAQSSNHREILHNDKKCIQNFGWPFFAKIRAKTCKILRNFGRRYISTANISGTDKKYLKSDNYVIDREFSRVRQKLGKLWSTNYGDLEAKSYPSKIPKSTFAEDHISALGGARHQIFTRARE